MSDAFDYMEFLKPKTAKRKATWEAFPLISLPTYQAKTEDDILNTMISRHLPKPKSIPPVVVRTVRRFGAEIPMPMLPARKLETGRIAVNAIRPYSGKTRTSCYWQDSGWERRGDYLIGSYKAGRGSYPGCVEMSDSIVEPFLFYIYDPPDAILTGSHGACFMFRDNVDGTDKYFVHFSKDPPDIDSGIIQIQRDLRRALRA